jgi:shikimate dehydrogenase
MIEATVIGWPIKHSRSPLIHNHWLKLHGIDGLYSRVAVPPENLGAHIANLRHGPCVGTNVTLPHKETAIAAIDEADDRVRAIGALNTIWRENGKLYASSTDGPGFIANVTQTLPHFDFQAQPVTLLGAGGSARAICDELIRQRVDRIYVHNRTLGRATVLAETFGPKIIPIDTQQLPNALRQSGFLINTTATELEQNCNIMIPWEDLNPRATVADIVYTPLITPFLTKARERDHAIIPGLGMLLHQAVFGFEKWFGVRPTVTSELHDLVKNDILSGSKA